MFVFQVQLHTEFVRRQKPDPQGLQQADALIPHGFGNQTPVVCRAQRWEAQAQVDLANVPAAAGQEVKAPPHGLTQVMANRLRQT
ncbi:hypothetical protein GCM10027567_10270 [Spongiibacter taiwanensis]